MKQLTILCDMDGILVDLLPYWLVYLKQRYPEVASVSCEDITLWEMHKCGALKDIGAAKTYGVLREPGFFRNAPAIPGALLALKRLQDDGHKIVIVSSPSGGVSAKEKFEWLAEHAPWLKEDQIILANQKLLVKGDVLIDDRAETLIDYVKTWKSALCLGIEYPYNRSMVQMPGWLELVKSYSEPEAAWLQIYKLITEEANRR